VLHRGLGKTEDNPREEIVREWDDLTYLEYPANKARAQTWKLTGFFSISVGTNLFIWLWKYHSEHEHTNTGNYKDPEIDDEVFKMTFRIHGAPLKEDSDEELKQEESEGEATEKINWVDITTTIYCVEENDNEDMQNVPKKVFVHFTREAGDSMLFYKTLRELMNFGWEPSEK